MALVFLYLALGLVPAIIARKKGHNGLWLWLLGALCFPLALLIALLIGPKRPYPAVVVE